MRLYRNTTDERVTLTWTEGGEVKELVSARGRHFLDSFGKVSVIEVILKDGRATIVRTHCQLYLLNFKG